MRTRLVTYHTEHNGHKSLQVVTVFEEGVNRERVKRENRKRKRIDVLVRRGQSYAFK